MATISVYLNEKASNGNHKIWRAEIFKHLFRHDLNFRTPTTLEELKQTVYRDIERKTDYIFSVGGDGTANAIMQEMVGSDTRLLIIPAGTANDFASELGLSNRLEKIMKVFQHQTTTKIDVIAINDKCMFSNGGIGIASTVAQSVNAYRKKIKGFKSMMKAVNSNIYPIFLIKQLLAHKLDMRKVHITCDDYPLERPQVQTMLLMINNQPTLGGKFKISPQTKNDDGKFNVSIFLHKNKIDFMRCAKKILNGVVPSDDPYFISFETNKIKIKSVDERPLVFFGDGEILKDDMELDISIIPRALEVCSFDDQLLYSNNYSLDQVELL